MLEKIPTPLSGAACNEKTGWLPPNFDDNCREILNEAVSNLIRTSEADDDDDYMGEESFEKCDEEEAEGDDESTFENDVGVFKSEPNCRTSMIIIVCPLSI